MKKTSRNEEIVKMAKSGKTLLEIAKHFGITKSRAGQIVRESNIDPRTVRRYERIEKLVSLKKEAEKQLNTGLTIADVRNSLKIDTNTASQLKEIGLNLSLVDREEVKKRRKMATKLYKSGKTAYEIMDVMPELKTPSKVYHDVCTITSGSLPKRKSTYSKRSDKLTKKIKSLKKKHSFSRVCEILNEEGVTNINGGKIKMGALVYHFYKK